MDNTITPHSHLRSLQIYCYYRLFISFILLGFFVGRSGLGNINIVNSKLYFATTSTYIVICLLSLITVYLHRATITKQAMTYVCADIFTLTLLIHASGGLNSNLTILLVVAVAAGNILIVGRLATFIAALATLGVLYEEFYYSLNTDSLESFEFVQAGTLGIAFFATAAFAQQLAKRLRESENLATQRGADLAELEQLNHLIIQRMRTGIIAINDEQNINLINDAAWQILGKPDASRNSQLHSLSPKLETEYQHWLQHTDYRCPPFQASNTSPEILCNFTHLNEDEQTGVLIFLEDQTQMTQQAQQMKLASLGTLTASIAHEIRNPLGAISHAAQLLQESTALDKSDARLAEIIQQHSLRMNTIIENVLQLSRRSYPHAKRLTLVTYLNQFIQEFKLGDNSDSNIGITVEPGDLETRIDASQLSQVLTNLCQNGLRYSREHTGKPLLNLLAGKTTGNERPYIDVIDYGKGISAEEAEHIFEPFFTTGASGTGLGLYIARELCEANEARLNYIPMQDQGSCFRITLPHPNRITASNAANNLTA